MKPFFKVTRCVPDPRSRNWAELKVKVDQDEQKKQKQKLSKSVKLTTVKCCDFRDRMAKKPHDLIILDRCKQQLVAVKDLPTLLDIRNKVRALADYNKAKKDGFETANYAKSIVSLAEARGGQVLKQMQEDGELASRGQPKKEKSLDGTFLSDLNISKNESSRMQTAAAVLEEHPTWFDEQLAECNESGKDFTQQAVVREGRRIKNDKTKKRKARAPKGTYSTIVIDPPWPMKKIEREIRPNQSSAIDYPTMTEDELKQLKLPSAPDCHLWVWTTHRFLPMALRIIPEWGFKYVCTFVWHKPGGFQPVGLPQYNCEFAIYCRKGSPKFSKLKDFKLCFEAARGKHSVKPEAFYDMVRSHTSGKRIDMFNRREIAGFDVWGNES